MKEKTRNKKLTLCSSMTLKNSNPTFSVLDVAESKTSIKANPAH